MADELFSRVIEFRTLRLRQVTTAGPKTGPISRHVPAAISVENLEKSSAGLSLRAESPLRERASQAIGATGFDPARTHRPRHALTPHLRSLPLRGGDRLEGGLFPRCGGWGERELCRARPVPRAPRSPAGPRRATAEYFCFEGDKLWTKSDAELVDLASEELAALRLADPSKVERGHVVRVPQAYPMYDSNYSRRVATIREWLDPIENLQQVGRNGLHRYNNSDHSMLTAIRAVENCMRGAGHDIWAVNVDSSYHEEATADQHPYRAAPETPAMAG